MVEFGRCYGTLGPVQEVWRMLKAEFSIEVSVSGYECHGFGVCRRLDNEFSPV